MIIINTRKKHVPEQAYHHSKRGVPKDVDDVADAGVDAVGEMMIPSVADHGCSSCVASSAAKSRSH